MFKDHPKGLFVAFFANMGERFGFYTMMAILVLFLQARYDLSASAASQEPPPTFKRDVEVVTVDVVVTDKAGKSLIRGGSRRSWRRP